MIKAIIATLLGAAVTAGIVYVAMNPGMLDKLPDNRVTSAERVDYEDASDSKSTIDDLVKAPDTKPTPKDVVDPKVDAADTETKVMVTNPDNLPENSTQDLPKDVKLNPRPNLVTVEGGDIEAALSEPPEDTVVDEQSALELGAKIYAGDGSTGPHRSDEIPLAASPQVPDRLIAEADKITEPRLRDQAYLSIVDYGLSISDLDGASSVISKIDNSEYRFTAQSNLAVAYAKAGDADGAFAVVSAIEDTQFADIVRMQVIESLSGRETPN